MHPPLDQLTANGYEMQFGTNALGPYYLTKLLLPVLVSTAAESGSKARIITTSSLSHELAPKGGINWETLIGNDEKVMKAKKNINGQPLYGQSKWVCASFHSCFYFISTQLFLVGERSHVQRISSTVR
jgi:NAD(P)-dependent dehydrogenase (short-subunit alcohol dehydrogenase family)